jgi:hypothetical protein
MAGERHGRGMVCVNRPLYCYATCTAMFYTGRADGQVHGRVKKIEGGGRRVGELLSFPLDHSTRLILACYLTVYSTKLFTLFELYCFLVLASLRPIHTYHAVPMPFVNSHMPCRAPALLQQCRVLRESPHSSRKYPNCYSSSLTERLFCCVLLPLFSPFMTNVVWFHTGHLHLRLVCF